MFPERPKITKLGGPGKQFWSDGRDWPLPKGYQVPDTAPLLGQWRVEVSPRKERSDDLFLHLIQVGDAALERMVRAELVRKNNRLGFASNLVKTRGSSRLGRKAMPPGISFWKETARPGLTVISIGKWRLEEDCTAQIPRA